MARRRRLSGHNSRVTLPTPGHLPERVCRHRPVTMSHTLTVESAFPEMRMLFLSSMPDVRLWWPIRVWRHCPVSTSHTRMLVSREPLTTCTPSNCVGVHVLGLCSDSDSKLTRLIEGAFLWVGGFFSLHSFCCPWAVSFTVIIIIKKSYPKKN